MGNAALYTLFSFLIGSIPFSALLVAIFARKDIRKFGEGNPGTANAFRAGGSAIGVAALILDSFKGVIPVALWAHGLTGWQGVLMTIAPVAGHAFSPFLKFRGGKAIATSFGIWTGLGLWGAPISMGTGAIASSFLMKGKADEVKVAVIFSCLGAFLTISRVTPQLWWLFAANCTIVAVKHAQYALRSRSGGR